MGTDITNGIDSTGASKQGLAIDFAPFSVIPGARIPLNDYRDRFGSYMLANTQLSVGAVRGAGGGTATDVGVGLRFTLINRGDPIGDPAFMAALQDKRKQCGAQTDYPKGEEGKYNQCLDTLYRNLQAKWLAENWNGGGLSISGATAWRFLGSRFYESQWVGFGAWMTGSLGIGNWAQAVLQVRFDRREGLPEPASENQAGFGGRLLLGSASYNLYFQYVGSYNVEDIAGVRRYTDKISTGVEYRLSDGMWLSTGFGSSSRSSGSSGQFFVIANLRLQVSQGPSLK